MYVNVFRVVKMFKTKYMSQAMREFLLGEYPLFIKHFLVPLKSSSTLLLTVLLCHLCCGSLCCYLAMSVLFTLLGIKMK